MQVQPGDLLLYPAADQTEAQRLDEVLTEFLLTAKNMIDRDRNRDYEEEVNAGERSAVPPGIVNAAYRLATNMYIRAIWNQHAQGVKSDNFDTSSLTSNIFTEDISRDLLLFPAKPNFGFKRMRGRKELDELAAAAAAL